MRKELKARSIKKCKVLYSLEPSIKPTFAAGREEAAGWQKAEAKDGEGSEKTPRPRAGPGSKSFVPATAGLILAGQVIRDLTGV